MAWRSPSVPLANRSHSLRLRLRRTAIPNGHHLVVPTLHVHRISRRSQRFTAAALASRTFTRPGQTCDLVVVTAISEMLTCCYPFQSHLHTGPHSGRCWLRLSHFLTLPAINIARRGAVPRDDCARHPPPVVSGQGAQAFRALDLAPVRPSSANGKWTKCKTPSCFKLGCAFFRRPVTTLATPIRQRRHSPPSPQQTRGLRKRHSLL